MEFEKEDIKQVWSKPRLFILDFNKTKGGLDNSQTEDFTGNVNYTPDSN